MLKILSIDFDYFQKVTPKIIKNYYPAGLDVSPEVSSFIWYTECPDLDKLSEVTVNKEEIDNLKTLLKAQTNVKKIMVSDSHKDIYSFVKEDSEGNNVKLYNIDMHHDLFNNHEYLDCGNWISHLKKLTKNLDINWICNPISEECYGLDERFNGLLMHSVDEIKENDFDYVFLCRSDAWLPPHLDTEFGALWGDVIKIFKVDVEIKNNLYENRMQHLEKLYNANWKDKPLNSAFKDTIIVPKYEFHIPKEFFKDKTVKDIAITPFVLLELEINQFNIDFEQYLKKYVKDIRHKRKIEKAAKAQNISAKKLTEKVADYIKKSFIADNFDYLFNEDPMIFIQNSSKEAIKEDEIGFIFTADLVINIDHLISYVLSDIYHIEPNEFTTVTPEFLETTIDYY